MQCTCQQRYSKCSCFVMILVTRLGRNQMSDSISMHTGSMYIFTLLQDGDTIAEANQHAKAAPRLSFTAHAIVKDIYAHRSTKATDMLGLLQAILCEELQKSAMTGIASHSRSSGLSRSLTVLRVLTGCRFHVLEQLQTYNCFSI